MLCRSPPPSSSTGFSGIINWSRTKPPSCWAPPSSTTSPRWSIRWSMWWPRSARTLYRVLTGNEDASPHWYHRRFMSDAIPTVVIVGRPNVGKSTLFNRITGQRRAIVGDQPGMTRDRIYGTAEHDGRRFEVIDTGGIVVHDQEYIPAQILRQAEVALENAQHIIFLVDGRSEITGSDQDLAQFLKRLGKPVT